MQYFSRRPHPLAWSDVCSSEHRVKFRPPQRARDRSGSITTDVSVASVEWTPSDLSPHTSPYFNIIYHRALYSSRYTLFHLLLLFHSCKFASPHYRGDQIPSLQKYLPILLHFIFSNTKNSLSLPLFSPSLPFAFELAQKTQLSR